VRYPHLPQIAIIIHAPQRVIHTCRKLRHSVSLPRNPRLRSPRARHSHLPQPPVHRIVSATHVCAPPSASFTPAANRSISVFAVLRSLTPQVTAGLLTSLPVHTVLYRRDNARHPSVAYPASGHRQLDLDLDLCLCRARHPPTSLFINASRIHAPRRCRCQPPSRNFEISY
jgi:hypothetical protein